MSTRIANIYCNIDSYPNDYQMDIWMDNSTGTFYIMDPTLSCYNGSCRCEGDSGCGGTMEGVGNMAFGHVIPVQTWTLGETCRWIHTGNGDENYNWLQVGEVTIWDNTEVHYAADKSFQKWFLDYTLDALIRKGFHHITFDIWFPEGAYSQ
jgi:hypothetical protein